MIFGINTTLVIFQNCLKFKWQWTMKLRITISKYHSWYSCQISLLIMLLPIQIAWSIIFFAVSGGSWKLHVSQTSYEMDRKLSQGKLERRGSHSIFFERQVNCRLDYQPLFGKMSPVKKRLIVKLISRNFKQLDTLPYEEFICHETTVGYDRDYTFLQK